MIKDEPIGVALKHLRVFLLNLNQVRASKLLEISSCYLSELESGKKPVNIDLIRKYSKILNVKPSDILFFAEFIETPTIQKIRKAPARKIRQIMEVLFSTLTE